MVFVALRTRAAGGNAELHGQRSGRRRLQGVGQSLRCDHAVVAHRCDDHVDLRVREREVVDLVHLLQRLLHRAHGDPGAPARRGRRQLVPVPVHRHEERLPEPERLHNLTGRPRPALRRHQHVLHLRRRQAPLRPRLLQRRPRPPHLLRQVPRAALRRAGPEAVQRLHHAALGEDAPLLLRRHQGVLQLLLPHEVLLQTLADARDALGAPVHRPHDLDQLALRSLLCAALQERVELVVRQELHGHHLPQRLARHRLLPARHVLLRQHHALRLHVRHVRRHDLAVPVRRGTQTLAVVCDHLLVVHQTVGRRVELRVRLEHVVDVPRHLPRRRRERPRVAEACVLGVVLAHQRVELALPLQHGVHEPVLRVPQVRLLQPPGLHAVLEALARQVQHSAVVRVVHGQQDRRPRVLLWHVALRTLLGCVEDEDTAVVRVRTRTDAPHRPVVVRRGEDREHAAVVVLCKP
eukprot:Rhum_TRINITY_DN14356_c16_g1::Rhum_TRINITY_DN14356_c16_g1_i1::g.84611::m.84611